MPSKENIWSATGTINKDTLITKTLFPVGNI